MKKTSKILLLLLVLCFVFGCVAACEKPCEHEYKDGKCVKCGESDPNYKEDTEPVDYVSQLKLDMSSNTAKQEVTVKLYIDGDTTHFYVPESVISGGVLKARYLAINTPESTGQIEPYGKTASNFTKGKLSTAAKILVESDSANWEADSTGSRYMAWVWYKTEENGDWRNLNLEILQNGLAIASSTANNRYGEICMKALNQARNQKLNVFSGEPDPNMYYGDAKEITLKELRTNIASYEGIKVAFEGVSVINYNNGVYVEDYDEETGMYFGMYVYYGTNASGEVIENVRVGNRARIVGTVTEFQGSWQVSGLKYRVMKPKDPDNTQKISDGHSGAFVEISADDLTAKKTIAVYDHEADEEVMKEFNFGDLALATSVTIKHVRVTSTYTTSSDTASNGAVTITGVVDGKTVTIRTSVLLDSDGKVVKEDYYKGKTLTVRGIVDLYNNKYQIQVFALRDVIIED